MTLTARLLQASAAAAALTLRSIGPAFTPRMPMSIASLVPSNREV